MTVNEVNDSQRQSMKSITVNGFNDMTVHILLVVIHASCNDIFSPNVAYNHDTIIAYTNEFASTLKKKL